MNIQDLIKEMRWAIEVNRDVQKMLVRIASPLSSFARAEVGSYRGYYEQLAIGHTVDRGAAANVGDLIAALDSAIGKSFTGYKGGEFVMGHGTPVWVSSHGACSGALVVGFYADKHDATLIVGPKGWEL